MTPFDGLLIGLTFLCVGCLVLLIFVLVGGGPNLFESRINTPARDDEFELDDRDTQIAELARKTLPRLGKMLTPKTEAQRGELETRLLHAGYYGRSTLPIFLGVKVFVMILSVMIGGVIIFFGWLPLIWSISAGLFGCTVAILGPEYYLASRKHRRQAELRKALPDAFDVIGLCLEGGMSMPASFNLVVDELRYVHPLLVGEMDIVQREVQLGRSTGEALDSFAERCDLDEARSMAAAVLQSERLGSSLVHALRVSADTLRERRVQKAEETAHKASTKILFPTLLCIFPAMFLVVMGPSVIHISEMFARIRQ